MKSGWLLCKTTDSLSLAIWGFNFICDVVQINQRWSIYACHWFSSLEIYLGKIFISIKLMLCYLLGEQSFEPRVVLLTPDRKFSDLYVLGKEIGKWVLHFYFDIILTTTNRSKIRIHFSSRYSHAWAHTHANPDFIHIIVDKSWRAVGVYTECFVLRGRFGSVYMCTEKKLRQIFAAKIIKLRPSQREEKRMEVDIMNQLHHSKLLLLWDAFESQREMILVMEQWVNLCQLTCHFMSSMQVSVCISICCMSGFMLMLQLLL